MTPAPPKFVLRYLHGVVASKPKHCSDGELLNAFVARRDEAPFAALTPEQLRQLRAVAVLEWSNRPEASEHLRRLAGGAPAASLTRAAKAAWQRR